MTLRPLSEKDRLYYEMKTIYERMGMVLRGYEAATLVDDRPAPEPVIINPMTGEEMKIRAKKKPRAKKKAPKK